MWVTCNPHQPVQKSGGCVWSVHTGAPMSGWIWGGSLVQTQLWVCASCQMLQVAAGFQQNCYPDEVKYLYKCFVELVLSVQRSDCPLNMILFLTRGRFPGNFIFFFRNHEFYGQKASIHEKHRSVETLCFGDYRVFMFLHLLECTVSVPCNGKCFLWNSSCFFHPYSLQEKNKIKISKARTICSWAKTAYCALSKLKFKEKLWRTWEPEVIWSYSKSQSRLLLHEAEWKMYSWDLDHEWRVNEHQEVQLCSQVSLKAQWVQLPSGSPVHFLDQFSNITAFSFHPEGKFGILAGETITNISVRIRQGTIPVVVISDKS